MFAPYIVTHSHKALPGLFVISARVVMLRNILHHCAYFRSNSFIPGSVAMSSMMNLSPTHCSKSHGWCSCLTDKPYQSLKSHICVAQHFGMYCRTVWPAQEGNIPSHCHCLSPRKKQPTPCAIHCGWQLSHL